MEDAHKVLHAADPHQVFDVVLDEDLYGRIGMIGDRLTRAQVVRAFRYVPCRVLHVDRKPPYVHPKLRYNVGAKHERSGQRFGLS